MGLIPVGAGWPKENVKGESFISININETLVKGDNVLMFKALSDTRKDGTKIENPPKYRLFKSDGKPRENTNINKKPIKPDKLSDF